MAPSSYRHPDGTLELDFEIAAGIDPFADSDQVKREKLRRYYAKQKFWGKLSGTFFVALGAFWLGTHLNPATLEAIVKIPIYDAVSIAGAVLFGLCMLFGKY